MKKTLLITSAILAFFCFSCDDELLDPNITIETPTNTGGGTTGGGNTGGGTTGGGNTGGGTTGSTLSVYSLDTTSNVPIFGEIIVNTDFIINNGLVVSANVETTTLGFTGTAVSTLTRDGNGRIIQSEAMSAGSVTNRTTFTYTGDNITQIAFEDFEDPSENYTYTFTYTGNTVLRTNVAAAETMLYTFNSNSQLISMESFSGTTSTQLEVLTYDTNGNCVNSTLSGDTNVSNSFLYDNFTNPLKPVFNDQFLLAIFDNDNNSEIGTYLATFFSTNNWITLDSSDGVVDLNPMYNANNDITSRNGNIDLGDGVVIQQTEAFQY